MLLHMAWVTTPQWNQSRWSVAPWSITEAPTGDMVWLGPIGMIRKAPVQLSRFSLLRPDLSTLQHSQSQCTWQVCYANSVRKGRHGRLIQARIQRKSFFLSPFVSGLVAFGLNFEACWSDFQWILPGCLKSGQVCGEELPWNTDASPIKRELMFQVPKRGSQSRQQNDLDLPMLQLKQVKRSDKGPCNVQAKLHLRLEGCRNPSHWLTVLS